MSIAKLQPNTPLPSPERRRYSWEGEQTLVEERRRRTHRVRRFIGGLWLPVTIIVILTIALFNADVMRAVLAPLSVLTRLLFGISFVLIQFVAMFYFLGRSRMYTIWPGAEGVSFKDYRGQPEILDQAKQIVKLLRGVRVFEDAGGEPLNGLLLEGPPGTGKTWLAQAISTEAGVPFFYVDASSMNSMFVGIAPLKVANLYRKARKASKEYGASVVFIDEIDAIGGTRGGVAEVNNNDSAPSTMKSTRLPIMMGGMMGGNQGLLSTMLIEMSGFSLEHGFWARKRTWFYKTFLRRNPPKPQKRVLTIGATNRIQVLDPALLRPGRFDKKIRIDAPDLEGRYEIIQYYLSKVAHDDEVDPLILANETPYYTPADLKYLLNEALRYALFDDRTYVTMRDIRMAQPEHEYGVRSPIKNMTVEDKYRLAAHEAGHAVAVRLFMPNYRIARITIIRQGGAHGYVKYYPATEDFDYISTVEALMNRLRVAVGGKAGEIEFCGMDAQTLGVGVGFADSSDFGHIRAVLYMMANAGMFGQLGETIGDEGTNLSPELREQMEETFRTVLNEVRIAFRLHRGMGEALIAALVEHEELLAEDVEKFFDEYGFYTPKVQIGREEDEGEIIAVNDQ